jgi:hypothetical protein
MSDENDQLGFKADEAQLAKQYSDYKDHIAQLQFSKLFEDWVDNLGVILKKAEGLNIKLSRITANIYRQLNVALDAQKKKQKKYSLTDRFLLTLSLSLRRLTSAVRDYDVDYARKHIPNVIDDLETVIEDIEYEKVIEELKSFVNGEGRQIRDLIQKTLNDIAVPLLKKVSSSDELAKSFRHARNKHDGELGHYAFPLLRHSIGYDIEANTKLEEYVAEQLALHFVNATPLNLDVVEFIKKCLKDGQYKDIFHPPKQKFIYRGMQLDDKHAKLFLMNAGLTSHDANFDMSEMRDENVLIKNRGELYDTNMLYLHREGTTSSSWTTNLDKAREFAHKQHERSYNKTWGIILYAPTQNHKNVLVAGEGGLYDLGFTDDYINEYEVIA